MRPYTFSSWPKRRCWATFALAGSLRAAGIFRSEWRGQLVRYRVEAYLCRYQSSDPYASRLEKEVERVFAVIAEVSHKFQQTTDVETISRTIGEILSGLLVLTVYAAAASPEASPRELCPSLDDTLYEIALGDQWAAVIDEVRTIPDAMEGADTGDLDDIVFRVGKLVRAWVQHVGFDWRGAENDQTRLDVLKPYVWYLARPIVSRATA